MATTPAERLFFRWILPALLAGVFVVYTTYRQRYVGATDWYGYYQEGKLLSGGHLALPVEFPPGEYPAIAPMGFLVSGGQAMPLYPPGFPLLLAIGHLLGAPLMVTPVIGLVSCVLMFFLLRDFTDRWVAAVLTLVWAFLPIVVYGSTTLMSDLTAATCLIGAYLAYRRGHLFLSAWVMGFSLCVRPTNALFLIIFTLPLLSERRFLKYALHMIAPAVLYGIYNQRIYGSPFQTGYGDFRTDFVSYVFPQHFGFYLQEVLWQFTPVILGLALLGLRPWRREKLFLVLWFAGFLVLYSFWRSGGDRWWWSRFILPGFAPVMILAATGLARARDALLRRNPGPAWRNPAVVALFAATAAVPVFSIQYARSHKDTYLHNKGHDYYDVATSVAALVPPGSMVGSLEFSGSFRLYTGLTSFVSTRSDTPDLVSEGLRRGRRVFLAIESWNLKDDVVKGMFARFSLQRIGIINTWDGVSVYEITAKPGAQKPG